jgi:hypothetical protein
LPISNTTDIYAGGEDRKSLWDILFRGRGIIICKKLGGQIGIRGICVYRFSSINYSLGAELEKE